MFIRHDLFDTLNVQDIALFSFRVNDEIASPKMTEEQFNEFMLLNPKLELNNFGELIKDNIKYGIVLEYSK